MSSVASAGARHPVVAFGPEMPGWGSWDWIGSDLLHELASSYRTVAFQGEEVPECDVVVIVKHALSPQVVDRASRRGRVLYLPVDYFDGCASIDGYGVALRRCTRILVHCHRLARYFEPYASTEYLDHHIKYVTPIRGKFRRRGYVLWAGVRSNLEPLAEWVNQHALPEELWVLTNFEDPDRPPAATDFGFRKGVVARFENWTADKHIEWTAGARLALDIKGQDFRSRHKPPTKAMDFLASGVPLAMNADSSPVEHLAQMGFHVAAPDDERWGTERYWQETRRFGLAMRKLLSLRRVACRLRRVIDQVLQEPGK